MKTRENDISAEAKKILHAWIHDDAMRQITDAYGGSARWYRRRERVWRDGNAIEITKAELVLDLIRRVEIVGPESAYVFDELLDEDAASIDDPSKEEGRRYLTQRETIDAVRPEATTALQEAELLRTEREARAGRNKPPAAR